MPAIRHEPSVRAEAVALFERGFGRDAVSARLGLSKSVVKKWLLTYRAVGSEVLLEMGTTHRKYDWATKVAAAEAVIDLGKTKPEAMREFGIVSSSSLDVWCRKYREGGADGLRPKPKGRPKESAKAAPTTREQELEVRLRKLEAENAYLKKLEALRAEEKLRTGSRPRW